MIAVGIDIGKAKHAVAVIDESGRPLCRPTFYTNDRAGADKLLADLGKVARPQDARVGMEATGNYWFPFHDVLVEAGYPVDVINPIVTAASISGDVRGRKSDKGDAAVIARVVLSGGRAPRRNTDEASRRLMALTRHRSFMVRQRADMKRHLQSMLDVVFPEFHALFDDLNARLPLEILRAYPTASALARAHRTAVAKIVAGASRGRDAAAEADRLVKAARASLGVGTGVADTFGACIVSSVDGIRDMDGRIAEMDAAIEAFDAPALARIIAPIKGAGKLLPKVIASEFGDVSRFETDPRTGSHRGMYKRMLAYAGCEPRIRESGTWKGQIRMSKRGSGALRTALMQIAFTISRNDAHFKAAYERRVAAGNPHRVALSYVVADFLEIVCSLWRSKRTYTVEKPAVGKVVA